ncbi:hypothetical protein AVEN_201093-1 [Araneus ventricosus]|uniref:ATP-dependent DNA helicase n=1 Tax=Araneus ventricosus TaxID=182803 RepID=A0A4Y2FWR6_ARAVE|nr:hypothetical protein AVEN_201093-1 [Araneus ventricosus]
MGGVTMVLAGDFRQTLPIIPRGTRADEMQACLKSSYLWNGIQKLGLTTNMRAFLNGDPSTQQFADNLLHLGTGAITQDNQDGFIALQRIGRIVKTHKELKEAEFPNVVQHFIDHLWLCQRAIFVPRNEDVSIMNKQLLQELPGNAQVYKSIDTTCDINETVNYPTEFLNTLEPSGVLSYIIELKIGAPMMLLRNLHPPSLCNETRLCFKKLMPNITEATILTGHAAGKKVFIPRIPILLLDFPFQFICLQFPVHLSFAMSINKAQEQSLKVVGLELLKPCFSQDQLHVGCSRVGKAENLYILAPNGRTGMF